MRFLVTSLISSTEYAQYLACLLGRVNFTHRRSEPVQQCILPRQKEIMVLEVLVSALSMAAWAIGLYYHPSCANYLSGCFEPTSDVLILEEAYADIITNQESVTTVDDAILCEVYDITKTRKFTEIMNDNVGEDVLPRAYLIERSLPFPWSVCYQNDIVTPTVIPAAIVSDLIQRRGQ